MNKIDFIKNIPQFPQKSKQWLEQRKNKLTSSDSATALDINPYQPQFELLLKKCGYGPEFTGSESTFHGEKYETEAIQKYEKLFGKINYEFGLINYIDINPIRKKIYDFNYDLSFLAGSPDGISVDKRTGDLVMLEVKCPLRRKLKYGYCPDYYMSQVQLNMFILDIDKADYIEYIPLNTYTFRNNEPKMNVVRIYRDDEWIRINIPKLISFWEQVLYWKKYGIQSHPLFIARFKNINNNTNTITNTITNTTTNTITNTTTNTTTINTTTINNTNNTNITNNSNNSNDDINYYDDDDDDDNDNITFNNSFINVSLHITL